jgi:hypothetical protein
LRETKPKKGDKMAAEKNRVAEILESEYGWTWNPTSGLMTTTTGTYYDPESRDFVSADVFNAKEATGNTPEVFSGIGVNNAVAGTSQVDGTQSTNTVQAYDGPVVNPAYDGTLDLNGDGVLTVEEQNGVMSQPGFQDDYYVDVMSGGIYERNEDGTVSTTNQEPVYQYDSASGTFKDVAVDGTIDVIGSSGSSGSNSAQSSTQSGSTGNATTINEIVQQVDTSDLAKENTLTTGLQSLDEYARGAASSLQMIGNNQAITFPELLTRTETLLSDVGDTKTTVGGIDNAVTQGFAAQDTRFNDLDTAVSGVNDTVGANKTALAGLDTRFNTTDQTLSGLGSDLSQGFTDTRGDVSNLQKETLGNQTQILSDLGTAKTERDAANVVSAEAQAQMIENQEGFKSNFDDYVKDYTTDTALQNNTLGGIQSGLTNFAGDVNDSVANLGNTLTGLGQDIDTVADQTSNNVQSVIEGGFSDLSAGQQDINNNIAAATTSNEAALQEATNQQKKQNTTQLDQLMGQFRTLSQLSDLPTTMRQQFSQLSEAFDNSGNLIMNSIDSQGNTIVRRVDAQGNLILDKFNAAGAGMGQMVIDVNSAMSQMNQLTNIPGGNAGMGTLSAPLQDLGTDNGGFMSPYGMTQ